MKNLAIVKSISQTYHKAAFQLQKHAPEILIVGGVIGTVVSAVGACYATTKLSAILDETRSDIDKVHEAANDASLADRYTPEDAKKDTTIIYTQTAVKIAKLYAPSVILGTLSLGSILASNNILRKRNIALGAAYATIDKSFKEYRSRVVERFGEQTDRELRYNIKAKEVVNQETDPETGETKTTTKTDFVVSPSDISGYARFFEQYTKDERGNSVPNPNWCSNNEYNLLFIKAQERYLNDLLIARGRVFLNEAYVALGLPRTRAGQVVGWVYDPDKGAGDNYIDFGLYKDNLSYSDFVNGYDNAILLDFNVDGNILDLMK